MGYQLLVVYLVMDVKLVPKVVVDHHAATSQFSGQLDILKIYATKSVCLLVNHSIV